MKLLDTSAIIGLFRGEEKIEKLVAEEQETLYTCFPVQYELYRGTRLARKTEEGRKQVESLLDELENLEADRKSARKVSELREKYSEIKLFDLMIAGICLANEVEIITKDRDFEEIEELRATVL